MMELSELGRKQVQTERICTRVSGENSIDPLAKPADQTIAAISSSPDDYVVCPVARINFQDELFENDIEAVQKDMQGPECRI